MDLEDTPKIITLISKENSQHKISLELFSRFSLFVKDNITSVNFEEPLQCELNGTQIEQVLQFVRDRENGYQEKRIQKPLPSGNIQLYLQQIDFQFINSMRQEKDLYLLLKAAEFFRVECLTEIIFAYIASQFLDKTNQELREKYGINEQLTEQTEKQLRDKYGEFLNGTPLEE